MSAPDYAALSEHFCLRESVLENLYDEYLLEVEAFDLDIEFFDYLVEECAQYAYLNAALQGGDAVDCLEAYDNVYDLLTEESNDG
jgi:hypothetical protein